MARQIFINLPVRDVAAATAFYAAIGGQKDDRFSNEASSMMRFTDTITVMLLSHARFADFTSRTIADAHATCGMLLCLSCDDRAAVDAITEAAARAGGRADPNPSQDYGFMYGRSFEDPDGHVWEPMWMDMDAAMAAMPAQPETADA